MNWITMTVSQEAMTNLSLKDPRLGAYIAQVGALSRTGIEDPYIATLDAIIAQQVSAKAAQSISDRFFEAFPHGDAQTLLDAPIDAIRACGLSGSKAQYLKNIAQAKASGQVPFDLLHTMETSAIVDVLMPIKGVGRWTVEMVLIFSLQKMDVMSYDDLAIRRGIQRLYHKKEVTPAFFEKLRKKLSPHQTYASFYFWKASLEKENIPYTQEA